MSDAPVLQSTVKMHAHRCEKCAAAGKEVVWIHPDSDVGQVASHRCPECGTVNWKQSKVDNGKLPPPLPKNQQGVQWETVLGYAVLLVGVALLSYAAYVYIKDRQAKKAAVK